MKTRYGCISIVIGIALLDAFAATDYVARPLAKITFEVIDENRDAVAGAHVRVGFQDKLTGQQTILAGDTNAAGAFEAEGYAGQRLSSDVSKVGFYDSGSGWIVFKDQKDGKWLPWNRNEKIVMRRIVSPVALYAKRVQAEIPALDRSCGYDLEKGDWVAPFGKGERSDFVFTVHSDFKDRYNFTAEGTLGFSQPLDGLTRMAVPELARNSIFRWPRLAPENGYTAPHRIRFKNHDPRTGPEPEISFNLSDRDRGYFFRVRTVEQNGKIVAANYGKIVGDIGIDPRETKTCYVFFTYHFNPTSLDRNLEWDTKRNLLTGLSSEQTPRDP